MRFAQLLSGDVDRDPGWHETLTAPQGNPAQHLGQHLLAQRDDQSGFHRRGNEARRGDVAEDWILPAQQGLGAHQLAAGQRGLRLIDDLEAVVVDRRPQAGLQRHALLHQGLHLRGEKPEAIAALRLGLVQRGVGVLQEAGRGVAVGGEEADPDAGGAAQFMPPNAEGPRQIVEGMRREATDLVDHEAAHDDGELVAAGPGQGVGIAQAAPQALGYLLQQ